jgi:uncharacterized RDD family membrane protein YckC
MPNSPHTDLQGNPVALWRRLAAMLYDTLAVIGICFVVSGIAVGLNHGVAVPANHPGFSALLLLLNYLYFAFCWRRSGQTLGMKSWRIRVEDAETGARLSWSQTLVRFSVGIAAWLPAGMGYWWSVFDAERRSWTDRASHSRLVRVLKT